PRRPPPAPPAPARPRARRHDPRPPPARAARHRPRRAARPLPDLRGRAGRAHGQGHPMTAFRRPTDPGYDDGAAGYNRLVVHRPELVMPPRSVADVVEAV